MALDDVYRVRFTWGSTNEFCGITLDYQDKAPLSEDIAAQDLAGHMATLGQNELAAILSEGCEMSSVYVRNITQPAMPARFQFTDETGDVLPGNPLPFNKCLVISLKGNDPALVRQGRFYVSGCDTSSTTAGVFNSAFLTGPVAALTATLNQAITSGGSNWIPVITRTIVAGLPVPPTPYPVDTATATGIVYSQRRRQTRDRALRS